MNQIEISLRDNRTGFRPGEFVEGSANWMLAAPPSNVEVRLLWFTRGKGTTDANVVESSNVVVTSAMGDSPFRFRLPDAPYSFSGTLISLVWAVEVVAYPTRVTARTEFCLSSDGQEIRLSQVPTPKSDLQNRFQKRVENYANKRGLDPNTYRK